MSLDQRAFFLINETFDNSKKCFFDLKKLFSQCRDLRKFNFLLHFLSTIELKMLTNN